ncbi:MAG: hypothetical protein CMO01_19040 [Thalassobius sp.]|nr:hypothetical protein [Thalassovita sp.]
MDKKKKLKVKQEEGFSQVNINGEVSLSLEDDSLLFFPILRNYDDEDLYFNKVVNFPLGDQIGVFICKRIQKPNGRIGIDYVFKDHLEIYGISEDQIKEMAMVNFGNNEVSVNGMSDPETNDVMFQVSSKQGFVGGILLDSRFITSLSEQLNGKIVIGVINSDMIFITTSESSFESKFEEIAKSIEYTDVVNLNPASYTWKSEEMEFKKSLK